MPSVGDNWIENPLGVVDRLFGKQRRVIFSAKFSLRLAPQFSGLSRQRELEGEERSQDWGVEEYFRERFLEKNGWAWVRSLVRLGLVYSTRHLFPRFPLSMTFHCIC